MSGGEGGKNNDGCSSSGDGLGAAEGERAGAGRGGELERGAVEGLGGGGIGCGGGCHIHASPERRVTSNAFAVRGATLTTSRRGVVPSPTSRVIVSPACKYGCTVLPSPPVSAVLPPPAVSAVLPSPTVSATSVAATTARVPRRYAAEDTTTHGLPPLSPRLCSIQKYRSAISVCTCIPIGSAPALKLAVPMSVGCRKNGPHGSQPCRGSTCGTASSGSQFSASFPGSVTSASRLFPEPMRVSGDPLGLKPAGVGCVGSSRNRVSAMARPRCSERREAPCWSPRL
jgi:hypothetical protein